MVRCIRLLTLAPLVLLGALWNVRTTSAYWDTPTCKYVVTSFYLPAGEYLDAYTCQEFETTSLDAGVWTNVSASVVSVPELYAQADGFDTCAGGAYLLYAYADKTSYNTSVALTLSGRGTYRNCMDRHGYKNYGEAWGVDPPPTWHAATGQWCDNNFVSCS